MSHAADPIALNIPELDVLLAGARSGPPSAIKTQWLLTSDRQAWLCSVSQRQATSNSLPKVRSRLRPGSRIVSVHHGMGAWPPCGFELIPSVQGCGRSTCGASEPRMGRTL